MKKTILSIRLFVITCLVLAGGMAARATEGLRRPISPSQPAWIIHIDVWNYADPQKIIDMVPEDVRPYVIFNIATSSSDEKSPNGPNIYDSWMKVCAQNRVWTMIQCASGYFNRMPDTPDDVSAYEKYYQEYPNFLGFNFAEQYWGFDGSGDGAVTFDNRLQLFAKLLSLAKTYGGYLAVSFADSYHNANKMPVAYMKRNADINTFLSSSPEYFLCFEKYTQKKNFLYNESHCLGAWLSGFAGQYGIRFDSSGWVENGVKPDAQDGDSQYTIGTSDFVRAAGAIPVAEHVMLTGQTMMDGPELTWKECSTEGSTTTGADGFTRRSWEWFPQFNHITLDLFRKILDGTIRIPSKDEVMARTKVCVVNGGSGTDNDSYRIPAALYDGLYRNAADYGGLQGRDANHWLNNRWWMKSTGRYPAIPNMLAAGTLTDIGSKVAAKDEKINYLNSLFPAEYDGDIFAGRHENGWVTYNPYQYDDVTDANGVRTLSKSTKRALGTIPFQYNTCTNLSLDYAPYSLGIIREYADRVTFYLQNYEGGTDIIKISGASSQPTYTANSSATISESWANGIYTLTIEHSSAAVELTVNCSGMATGRNTNYTEATITTPAQPAAYTGQLQYEAELADYRNVTIHKTANNGNLGQGYASMNSSTTAALRFHVSVPEAGYYLLTLRYQATTAGNVTATIGDKNYSLTTTVTTAWTETHIPVVMSAGAQTIDLTNTGGEATDIDCIKMEKQNIAPFRYSTVNGEYHADFGYLTASGSVTFDAQTGQVSVPAGKSGALTLLLDAADFRKVTGVELVRTSTADDAFNYLRITDTDGNSVNPDGSQQAFWGSKYKLDYKNYQTVEASSRIYKLEWVANSAESARTMTISDLVVTMDESLATGIIDEDDGTPAVVPASVTTANITYSRTLAAPTSDNADMTIDNHDAKLYTVCLPYKPTTGNGLKYYTLSDVNDDTLVFEETATVSANTPYLVSVTSDNQHIGTGTAINVNFSASIADGTMHGGYQLRGTLRGLTNTEAEGCYILQTGNVWGRVPADTPSVYVPPFRAYIVATVGSQARLTSAISSQPSSIRYIKTVDSDGTGTFYDLQGRRMATHTRGLFIRDGKKVILK